MNTSRAERLTTIGPFSLRSACARRQRKVVSYGLCCSGGRSRSRVRSISAMAGVSFFSLPLRLQRRQHIGDSRRGHFCEAGAFHRGTFGGVAKLLDLRARKSVGERRDGVDDGLEAAAAAGIRRAQADAQDAPPLVGVG